MKDTSPETDRAFTALFAARSPSERLRMTCAMFDDAKALAEAGIRAANPDITTADLRIQLFERLYFGDFDEETRTRMIEALRQAEFRETDSSS